MNLSSSNNVQSRSSNGEVSVLVIDDTSAVRTLISRILTAEGYTVNCVEGGEQAVAIVRTGTFIPQLALIDLTMPGLNGMHVADSLRVQLPNLHVGIMSGFDRDDTLRAYGLNTDELAFLAKPFNRSQLLSFVLALSS